MSIRRLLVALCFVAASGALPGAVSQIPRGEPVFQVRPPLAVIPRPAELVPGQGSFTLSGATGVLVATGSPEVRATVTFLNDILQRGPGYRLPVAVNTTGPFPSDGILILVDSTGAGPGGEAYALSVTPAQVKIEASGPAGVFYAIQTLLQLMPAAVYDTVMKATNQPFELPAVVIRDAPRFPYRGMHLDVSRHFFPTRFVKRYIDLLAMHKFNVFHWHLTDDNGWRLEIRRYPKLSEISAWRVDRMGVKWTERQPPQPGERSTYGGFYTQDEVRDVVDYAARRHITVIPEIEMPGHSSEVLAAYPDLSCTGGPFYVQPGGYWPNVDIFCAGNDEVFTFIEGVLEEVFDLFPAPYVHIGGDEADKARWKECPKCQSRIRAEGLKGEHELQSYFMKRVERFVRSRGKTAIGWDEILEGGLPPEAIVMSWRGFEGGIEAARQGHDVIMAPTSHCYLDYYQANPKFEPETIGGLTTLREVYSFEPIPDQIGAEQRKHIKGAQGNLWTEYVPTPEKAEYMVLPRMCALAEVVWSPAELRSWPDFRRRLTVHEDRLEAVRVNYSRGSYRVAFGTAIDSATGGPVVVLSSEQDRPRILYTMDGSDPTRFSPAYEKPIPLTAPLTVRAAIFEGPTMKEEPYGQSVILHRGMRGNIEYGTRPDGRYDTAPRALIDGITGSLEHDDGTWAVFPGSDMTAVLALPQARPVRSVVLTVLSRPWNRIHQPAGVVFEVSADGNAYTRLDRPSVTVAQKGEGVSVLEFGTSSQLPLPAKFVRVTAKNPGPVPKGEPGEGMETVLCFDELIVE
ncbi:MAG: family 20 glycosylhydrolase [Bacteroidetes bacterium]|nr:family 20 glycosylhydrolase [Bacteroidota bacterium]